MKNENVFTHICTTIPASNWEKIKSEYHRIKKYNIDDFTPVIFDKKRLKEGGINELIPILLEGRKNKQIALIQFDHSEEIEEHLRKLSHRQITIEQKNIIESNTVIV